MEDTIQLLLKYCRNLMDDYEHKIIITGDDYNLFSILGHTSEELVHSKMIASLLDLNGKHHMGHKFLDAFIEEVGIGKDIFDSAHSSVKTEYPIGKINNLSDCPDGGRIDIVISDKNGHNIIIENKVYAKDQYRQLIRYNQHKSYGIPILYLTPTGKTPAKFSYSSENIELKKDVDFKCISYDNHICGWLVRCLKLDLPDTIKSIILQYLNIVNKITNQTRRNEMKEEIVNYIVNDSHNLDVVFEINNLIEKIQIKAQSNFWKSIEKTLQDVYGIHPEFTLDFKGSLAEKDVNNPVEKSVSEYISKNNAPRFFGYDIKLGTYDGHEVFLKICANENLLYYMHFRESGKHRNDLLNLLNLDEAIKDDWTFKDDDLRVMWRRPTIGGKKDVQYSMIDFGMKNRPSEYNVSLISEDFVNAANSLICFLRDSPFFTAQESL